MDFLSGLTKSGKPGSDQPSGTDHPDKPSSADLFANAKVVADAAQAQFNNESDKYDKAKAAAAAAELLDAASDYGKLDETQGVGKYVEQAEGYLRKYGSPAPEGHKDPAAAAPAGESGKAETPMTAAPEIPSGGGAEDRIKKAEESLDQVASDAGGEKKEPSSESGGGYGDLLKTAGGFLHK